MAEIAVTRLLDEDSDRRVVADAADGTWPQAWAEDHEPEEMDPPRANLPEEGNGSTPDASEIGRAVPLSPGPVSAPRHRLLLLIRLAASLGSLDAVDRLLSPGALTLLEGVPNEDLDSIRDLLEFILPASCTVSSKPRIAVHVPDLMVIRPSLVDGRISDYALREYRRDVVAALHLPAPVLILHPQVAALPEGLPAVGMTRIPYAPLDQDILLAVLRLSHSEAGGLDEAALRAALPPDAALEGLDPLPLALALRAPTAQAVATRLAALADPAAAHAVSTPGLESFASDAPALRTARQMVADLQTWRAGQIGWSELSRSLLLYGPPGSGKTWLARAIGTSAGVTVISATFGQWQAAGHLGDMLREMRRSFAEARAKSPAVLVIDEMDSVGSREDRTSQNPSYRRQVVNAFLTELDGIAQHEGVIVIGTCNDRSGIDPAVLRPGRIDQKVEMPLPDATALQGILRHHLPGWSGTDLSDLARCAVGLSAAEVDAAIRRARTEARIQARALMPDDLRVVLAPTLDDRDAYRVALHECGHAVVCAALRLGPVHRIALGRKGGGMTHVDHIPGSVPLSRLQDDLVQLLAGRAAEAVVLGAVSTGAGGDRTSDLARATALAVGIHARFGLGVLGPLWLGNTDTALLSNPDTGSLIRQDLEAAEVRARTILTTNRDILEDMARTLLAVREMNAEAARLWLNQVRRWPTEGENDPGHSEGPKAADDIAPG
ncbi:AAA family ATPase [Paracoccus benzoatiresistens]|uniref:AAA family ATPase n=1 Tax=Paracoccus benzoatiresistens TaxID=2997341 RepID=A0ABT4J7H0_9RHOB|nr:AAA family ATPase [Paracoccus sp. EF6]MCZ0962396.1 AAA family ATPase [Paracoccus sp. EF6]